MFFFSDFDKPQRNTFLIANGRKKKQTKFSIKYPDTLLVMFKDSELQLTICTLFLFSKMLFKVHYSEENYKS